MRCSNRGYCCGAVCLQPTRLFRNLHTEMDPPSRCRFRSGWDNPLNSCPRVVSCTTGDAMEWPNADDLGCQWATFRPVTHDTPHATRSRLAGDGNPDTGSCHCYHAGTYHPGAPEHSCYTRPASWYGYVAFVLAMPYPVLRTCWAMGSTVGLMYPGAAGSGFAPLLIAIPWILAAVLSLCLVSTRPWIPRRLLLALGWSATAIVAMIGPAAFWSMITKLLEGGDIGLKGMATWVPFLFYTSWFLWAIAAGAATRSYQLRSFSSADNTTNVAGS